MSLEDCHIWLAFSFLDLKLNILASRRIHTRAYPDPNPPEIVDNPERILWKSLTSRESTIVRHIHRANSTSEDFVALSDTQFGLDLPSYLPRTKSFSDIDHTDFEPPSSPPHSGQHISDRETPPSTPPDIHLIHNFGLSHPKYAQQSVVEPRISTIHILAAQASPLPPQNTAMAVWYAPLVLPQPLVPLPNDYQSKIPHFTGK